MAPPTQWGLLFHWRNRLSRTSCCFQLALMVAENHIIIQQEWMAANCGVSAAFSLFSSRRIRTKGFRLTESSKTRGWLSSRVPVAVMFRQASKSDMSFSGSTLTLSMWSVHHCTRVFPSFVNDFSLNLSCTLPKKSVPGGTFTSTFTLCPFKAQFSLFNWKLHFTNQILDEKIQQASISTSHPAWVLLDLLMGELQDVPGQMGYYSSSSIFRPLETCFPICCIPLCDALKTF